MSNGDSSQSANDPVMVDQAITAKPVYGPARLMCLPKHFGPRLMLVEHTIYHYMEKFAQSYTGGLWEYYELSNGGFYMAPTMESPVDLFVRFNGAKVQVLADAAGIIACLYVFSHLAFDYPDDDRLTNAFHNLRDFASQHTEMPAIFKAID